VKWPNQKVLPTPSNRPNRWLVAIVGALELIGDVGGSEE
jgi:hypothetical protein